MTVDQRQRVLQNMEVNVSATITLSAAVGSLTMNSSALFSPTDGIPQPKIPAMGADTIPAYP